MALWIPPPIPTDDELDEEELPPPPEDADASGLIGGTVCTDTEGALSNNNECSHRELADPVAG